MSRHVDGALLGGNRERSAIKGQEARLSSLRLHPQLSADSNLLFCHSVSGKAAGRNDPQARKPAMVGRSFGQAGLTARDGNSVKDDTLNELLFGS